MIAQLGWVFNLINAYLMVTTDVNETTRNHCLNEQRSDLKLDRIANSLVSLII